MEKKSVDYAERFDVRSLDGESVFPQNVRISHYTTQKKKKKKTQKTIMLHLKQSHGLVVQLPLYNTQSRVQRFAS